ncbi:MAG: lipopolysaccharide heptosyltransferase I [Sulfurovum sp.]|nr:MAG: lipopolysaccharide heptosyltransferase I [Sulfurovum sp.]
MKLAIVKLSAMGDIIHAMVALQYIKQANPEIQIDWIVEEGFAPILENNPHIDNILTVNLKTIKKDKILLFREMKKLRAYAKNRYDLVIDAQGLLKSALTAKLLGKNRAGFSKKSIRERLASSFYHQKIEIAYDANSIDRNVTVIGEPLEINIDSPMIINKEAFLFYVDDNPVLEMYLSEARKNIIFVIGSTWESRNYPKEKFVEVANHLKENILIAWGSEDEHERAKWIAENSSFARVLPKLTINALKAVIGKSDLVIGNDTGPTHMAWGLNIPSITIFGPTPINRVYQTPINRVIKSKSDVNHYKLNKKDFSITEIPSHKVILMAKELLIKAT